MDERVQPVKRANGIKPPTFDPHRLRRRRIAAGLGVRGLARAAKVSAGVISQLENGRTSASVRTLIALSTALGCTIEDLMPPECEEASQPEAGAA